MGQTCTVCSHPDAVAINEALVVEKKSNRAIARQYDLHHDAIRRHRQHIPELLVQAAEAMEIAEAEALLGEVRDLQRRAYAVLDAAEETGELRTALVAIREARGNLELLAKLLGELSDAPQVNVAVAIVEHPDYQRLEDAIVRALEPYDAARYAVADALKEIE